MKKILMIMIGLLTFSSPTWARNCFGVAGEYDPHDNIYAVVVATDGYANLRVAGNKSAEAKKQLPNGTLLNIFNEDETASSWCFDDQLNGYVHVSQLKFIDEFAAIPVTLEKKSMIELKNEVVQIMVQSQPFELKKHTFLRTNREEQEYQIDGIPTSSYSPKYPPAFEYQSVKIQFQNSPAFYLPKEALAGLYELSADTPQIRANYDAKNDRLYIQGHISDASVVASFVWVIENKKYLKRSFWAV